MSFSAHALTCLPIPDASENAGLLRAVGFDAVRDGARGQTAAGVIGPGAPKASVRRV